MTRYPGSHGYICECSRASCRERLYLPPHRYQELSRLGTVVAARCAARERRWVLVRFGDEIAVVKTAWTRIGAAA